VLLLMLAPNVRKATGFGQLHLPPLQIGKCEQADRQVFVDPFKGALAEIRCTQTILEIQVVAFNGIAVRIPLQYSCGLQMEIRAQEVLSVC